MMEKLVSTGDMIAQEHRVLLSAYARAQARCSVQLADQAARIAELEAQLMRTQAQIVIRDTKLALVREELAELAAAAPGLPTRVKLARRVEWLSERVQDLMRELLRLQWVPSAALQSDLLAGVRKKAVLYVGRAVAQPAGQAGANVAQQAIEEAGGRFLHHAGGNDGVDDVAALEASLVAADLVICQTGCVSHDAYWRVHDHCQRTGKQCVLVDQPQAMHFVRKEALASQV
ncbi:DUF2325 domain-containing protein [Janthinobacterium sp.]|uniref:DUF2325 domain-containing protein n=1 Tax=Janthinobacterium sp. TaxID=1871054 RepID=UPI00289C0928|nr:DUF2325 domain-containing protein [Janthinobacterium sp.]